MYKFSILNSHDFINRLDPLEIQSHFSPKSFNVYHIYNTYRFIFIIVYYTLYGIIRVYLPLLLCADITIYSVHYWFDIVL